MYLPEDVQYIINTLYDHGHEAYAVGGCVRDMMLGREPGDWDITTSAMPEETKLLFERTFDTGIEHGTITVLLHGVGYEVTTYRIDGKYEDSRHPSEVEFTRNLREDLQRRDFTINAMAYNDREGVVDIFEGMKDLHGKCIRCVGPAEARFGEDALRILRAIRFSAQLGFKIEEDTCRGIEKLAGTLANISAERIQVEMVKLIVSSHPDYIDCAYRLGVTRVIFPEWNKSMDEGDAGTRILKALLHTEPDKMVRLALLFYGMSESKSKEVLRRWKFDNETIRVVSKLVCYQNHVMELNAWGIRRGMHQMSTELFAKHLIVQRAWVQSLDECERDCKLEELARIERLYLEILEKNQCITLKQLAVSGKDLLACGVSQGKEVGEVLQGLLFLVLEHPECNTKEYLIEQVKQILEGK